MWLNISKILTFQQILTILKFIDIWHYYCSTKSEVQWALYISSSIAAWSSTGQVPSRLILDREHIYNTFAFTVTATFLSFRRTDSCSLPSSQDRLSELVLSLLANGYWSVKNNAHGGIWSKAAFYTSQEDNGTPCTPLWGTWSYYQ